MKNGKDAEDQKQNEFYRGGEYSENEVKGTANTKFLSHISGANASPFSRLIFKYLTKLFQKVKENQCMT